MGSRKTTWPVSVRAPHGKFDTWQRLHVPYVRLTRDGSLLLLIVQFDPTTCSDLQHLNWHSSSASRYLKVTSLSCSGVMQGIILSSSTQYMLGRNTCFQL